MNYILKNNELVEVYTDINDEYFGVGKVISYNDESLILHSILPNGEYDGIVLYKMDDIIKILSKTEYCKKIENILLKDKSKDITTYKFKSVEEILQASKNIRKIVDIQLFNSHQCDISGIVEDIQENLCLIQQITNFGDENGVCQFLIDGITSIKFDSLENREIELLLNK